jgi:hypothetical protein
MHQEEVNNFPMFFAFNNKQFDEGMRELGLDPKDTDKIYRLGSTGGYYRKTDAPALREMFERHSKEMEDAVKADTTGEGFIYDMFIYELANHEYCITYDLEPTLDALGLTLDEVNENPALLAGLKKAKKDYLKHY